MLKGEMQFRPPFARPRLSKPRKGNRLVLNTATKCADILREGKPRADFPQTFDSAAKRGGTFNFNEANARQRMSGCGREKIGNVQGGVEVARPFLG